MRRPFGIPLTHRDSLSDNDSRPRCTCSSTAVAVKDFVMLAIRTWSEARSAVPVARSPTPYALHVAAFGPLRAIETPGKRSLCMNRITV